MAIRLQVEQMVREAQNSLCSAVEQLDGARFREDLWQRDGGGGGVTRVLQDGAVFEKAGVNVSVVHGQMSRAAAQSTGGGRHLPATAGEAIPFFAAGLSTVLHPRNPHAPTAHANFRYFELGPADACYAWWFGGGADLTPAYLYDDDARHFHRELRNVCDQVDAGYYPRFKRWADEYFRIEHRGEARGVGGIFFDDLHDRSPEQLLAFSTAAAAAFAPAYLPLVAKRKDQPYDEAQRRWQLLRRGRYVEFNLVYDRGTAFGLRTGGRIESILMSLPLLARWEYDAVPQPGTEEQRLLDVLQHPRDWI